MVTQLTSSSGVDFPTYSGVLRVCAGPGCFEQMIRSQTENEEHGGKHEQGTRRSIAKRRPKQYHANKTKILPVPYVSQARGKHKYRQLH